MEKNRDKREAMKHMLLFQRSMLMGSIFKRYN